jgi:hypothetical protein
VYTGLVRCLAAAESRYSFFWQHGFSAKTKPGKPEFFQKIGDNSQQHTAPHPAIYQKKK